MVQWLVVAAALAVVALTFWRPLRRLGTALGAGHLLSTGHAFVALGALLGLAFGRSTEPLVDDLRPIVAFVAGWVGFATGMRFDLRVVGQVPGRVLAVALVPAVAAALAVGAAGASTLIAIGTDPMQAAAGGLVLAAAAASSGPTLVAVLRGRRAGRSARARPVLRMIELSAGVDDLVVVVLAMIAFALFRSGAEPIAPIWLLAAGSAGGVLLGATTWLFLGGRASEDERLLLGLAMLAFTAGFAGWLHLSPAGVTAIAAMTLVNMRGRRMKLLLRAVRRVERPAVVILMTVIGFHATRHSTWMVLPLAACMTVVRLCAKRWSADAAARWSADGIDSASHLATCRRWGDGLAPQGILGDPARSSVRARLPRRRSRSPLPAIDPSSPLPV